MPQITLTVEKAQKLLDFCIAKGTDEFFLAKDQGAYVGASNGPDDNCIFYFQGCDPNKDEFFYENASDMFGGDDFGEFLPVDWLKKLCAAKGAKSMTIKVLKSSIKAVYN